MDYVIRTRSQTKNESKLTMKAIKKYKRIPRENIPFYRLNTGVHLSQKPIQKPIKHVRQSFFAKIVNGLKL